MVPYDIDGHIWWVAEVAGIETVIARLIKKDLIAVETACLLGRGGSEEAIDSEEER